MIRALIAIALAATLAATAALVLSCEPCRPLLKELAVELRGHLTSVVKAGASAPLAVTVPALRSEPSTPLEARSLSRAQAVGYGRRLRVGPGGDFARPSEAARAARKGDLIEIEAAVYAEDSALWAADDLLIRGLGGMPELQAGAARLVEDKAIWVIRADNVRIENVAFSGAVSRDRNGAGIRAEGRRLEVVGCLFEDNESGLMTSNNPATSVLIEASEFLRNGHPDGQAHAIYAGRIARLEVRFSNIAGSQIGSALKSRAAVSRIRFNRIVDGADGRGNYSIDLSEGGDARVVGNLIEQGPHSENYHIIAYAPEAGGASGSHLEVVANTIVNDRSDGVFVWNNGAKSAVLANNLLVGPGRVVRGNALMLGNLAAAGARLPEDDSSFGRAVAGSVGNRTTTAAVVRDRAKLDYRPMLDSDAIGGAVVSAEATAAALAVDLEYRHPLGYARRTDPDAGVDIGALSHDRGR